MLILYSIRRRTFREYDVRIFSMSEGVWESCMQMCPHEKLYIENVFTYYYSSASVSVASIYYIFDCCCGPHCSSNDSPFSHVMENVLFLLRLRASPCCVNGIALCRLLYMLITYHVYVYNENENTIPLRELINSSWGACLSRRYRLNAGGRSTFMREIFCCLPRLL